MVDKKHKRALVDEILPFLDRKGAIVILGARQVGKTSLMYYLMEHHIKENVFYLDLELIPLLSLCNNGPEAIYQYLLQKGANPTQKIFLLIDEIQYLENPTNLIKVIHDHYENIKLLVSGSSTFEIKKKFKQSLAGRTLTFVLYPLSFEEFLVFKDKSYRLLPSNIESINWELLPLAKEYICYGGYPAVVLEQDIKNKQILLSQIINTYIRKDIKDIGNIRSITPFNNLLEVLASQSGQLLNIQELSNTLALSKPTIIEYLDLIENTFIIRRIKPFHKNIRSELSKQPKVFFMDTGMMHLLWLKEFPQVVLGNSFETFVFLELVKAGQPLHFWRTTNKQEIDFIVSGKKEYAIEVKHNFSQARMKTLEFFKKNYDCEIVVVGLEGAKKGIYPWEMVKVLKEGSMDP